MPDPTAIITIISVFGFIPAIVAIRARARYNEKKLELEAKTGGNREETKRILDENKLLRERVENLESIVCSVDFELNQKLAKVIDEQRSQLQLPASPTGAPSSGGAGAPSTGAATAGNPKAPVA